MRTRLYTARPVGDKTAAAALSGWPAQGAAVGHERVHVRVHEPRQIVERTVQREDFAETRTGDGEVPPFSGLRSKEREPPALESRAPPADGGAHRFEDLRSQRRG